MSSNETAQTDPLCNLRQAISINSHPITTSSEDPSSVNDLEPNLAKATHLHFNLNGTHRSFPLNLPTRFISSGNPVDFRSIYLAWQKKDVAIPDYIASTQRLNEELAAPGNAGGKVQNIVFVEKLDLITWLEGASDESEYITALASEEASAQASGAADVASGSAGGISTIPSGAAGSKVGKSIDPRLQEIYNGERKVGDRNSILRGIKPTDFSHIRKNAAAFLGHTRARAGPAPSAPLSSNPALVSNLKKPGRRPEPIILLSPSASSLLRMSNIKSFLDNGVYIPPDSALAGSSNTANILHISRILPSIDPSRPMRFVLVDSSDQFKPDYWQRVVAVFTTGQTWQFKSYKWTQAPELFSHALGIYLGWRGEDVPSTVRGWGRGVVSQQVDKWNPHQGPNGRWRDREVVELIWSAVEESMRNKGWTRDGIPSGR
ncbi:CDC73-domain-containing protein [Patellaria atrata CBS 101060]|uniref:CDC73-domain-containing protein n=1 Tax=Patellaria atrata CBS 101060 TaxID=1346257 RepID=A0A9P4VNC1_9PEZI|nr:CDC73-domain-containing protein [Patellaria atrata CBS 101060]